MFILNNVVMIYISADSLEDAFRLFSVMNDRGQKLSNADILKSSHLEKIEDGSEMNEYAREWENMQEDLGNDFDRFLAYVRTMLLKKRQKTVSVSAMLVSMRQKNIAQVSILERYFFVSTYQAAGPDTCLAVFVVASLPPCL